MRYRNPIFLECLFCLSTLLSCSGVVDPGPTNSYQSATSLRITSLSPSSIRLEWVGAEMYPYGKPGVVRPLTNTIQRSESNGSWVNRAVIPGDSTYFVDLYLDSSNTYSYRVESTFSDTDRIVSVDIGIAFGPSFRLLQSIIPHGVKPILADASPDGQYVAFTEPGEPIRLISSVSGSTLQEVPAQQSAISRVTFSEDGQYLLTLTSNPDSGSEMSRSVWLYQIPSLNPSGALSAQNGASLIAMVNDTLITCGSAPSFLFSSLNDSSIIANYSPDNIVVRSIDIGPDGSLLACGSFSDDRIRIVNIHSRTVNTTLGWPSKSPITISFSPDGRFLATGSEGHRVIIWAIPEWQTWMSFGTDYIEPLTASAFTNDGQYVITAGFRGNIRFWNVSDGKPFRKLSGHAAEITSLRVTHDGLKLISCGRDRVNIWSLQPTNLWYTLNP